MGFCAKCGTKLEDDDQFCPNCGAGITAENRGAGARALADTNEKVVQFTQNTLQSAITGLEKIRETNAQAKIGRVESVFVDPEEKLVSCLGNGDWILNLALLGKMQTINAGLTDKRIYLQGNLIDFEGKNLMQHKMEKTVNAEDVNATGFRYERNPGYLIAGVIATVVMVIIMILFAVSCANSDGALATISGLFGALPSLAATVYFFVKYYMSKMTYFYIEYAGGTIWFQVMLSDFAQVQDFSKKIHWVKDRMRRENRREMAGKE